ncbi:hypothetical protein N2152v2_008518 [Parachlorella kessleri]
MDLQQAGQAPAPVAGGAQVGPAQGPPAAQPAAGGPAAQVLHYPAPWGTQAPVSQSAQEAANEAVLRQLPVAEFEALWQRARCLSHTHSFRAIVEAAKRPQQGSLMAQLASMAGHTPGKGHGSLALAFAVTNRLAGVPDLAPREQQSSSMLPGCHLGVASSATGWLRGRGRLCRAHLGTSGNRAGA